MARLSPPVPVHVRLQGPLKESPAFVLMQAGRLAMDWTAEALELFELSVPQFATLALVHRLGAISQASIAERLGIGYPAMSALATSLEADGVVERRMDMFDGRRRALWITRAGVELLGEASDELTGVDAQFTERLGEDTLAALAELPPPRLSAIEHALLAAGWD